MIHLASGDSYHGFTYKGESIEVSEKTDRKLLFECKCGKSKDIVIRNITKGYTKSCGQCNHIILNHNDKFGEFIYLGEPIICYPQSNKNFLFQCKCGKSKLIKVSDIFRGKTKTCGRCDENEFLRVSEFDWVKNVKITKNTIRNLVSNAN